MNRKKKVYRYEQTIGFNVSITRRMSALTFTPSSNQISQDNRQTCTGFSQSVKMLSPALADVKNIYDFISAFTAPITTKIVMN